MCEGLGEAVSVIPRPVPIDDKMEKAIATGKIAHAWSDRTELHLPHEKDDDDEPDYKPDSRHEFIGKHRQAKAGHLGAAQHWRDVHAHLSNNPPVKGKIYAAGAADDMRHHPFRRYALQKTHEHELAADEHHTAVQQYDPDNIHGHTEKEIQPYKAPKAGSMTVKGE